MALIVDAGVLYAQADRAEPRHAAVVGLLRAETGPLITTEFVAAEADYLILQRLGLTVEIGFLDDLAEGTFQVECLTRAEMAAARDLAVRYRDLRRGIADASLVVLARRYLTRRIATFDRRAFDVVTPMQGGHFEILPAL